MMTGLHTRASTSSPFLQASGRGALEGREKAVPVEVMRDPYEWKSAFSFACTLFVASLALAPAPGMDHKKFAAEINTKTLRAAAAVTIPPRGPLRVRH